MSLIIIGSFWLVLIGILLTKERSEALRSASIARENEQLVARIHKVVASEKHLRETQQATELRNKELARSNTVFVSKVNELAAQLDEEKAISTKLREKLNRITSTLAQALDGEDEEGGEETDETSVSSETEGIGTLPPAYYPPYIPPTWLPGIPEPEHPYKRYIGPYTNPFTGSPLVGITPYQPNITTTGGVWTNGAIWTNGIRSSGNWPIGGPTTTF